MEAAHKKTIFLRWQVQPGDSHPQVDWLFEGSQASPGVPLEGSLTVPPDPPVKSAQIPAALSSGVVCAAGKNIAWILQTPPPTRSLHPRLGFAHGCFSRSRPCRAYGSHIYTVGPPSLASNCARTFGSCQDTLPIRATVGYWGQSCTYGLLFQVQARPQAWVACECAVSPPHSPAPPTLLSKPLMEYWAQASAPKCTTPGWRVVTP